MRTIIEPKRVKTKYKDKNNNLIYVGDLVHVQEFPDDAPFERQIGSLDFVGRIEIEKNHKNAPIVVVVYYDIGERESYPLKMFKKENREIENQEE